MKIGFDIGRWHWRFIIARHDGEERMHGMTNRCSDGRYVLFLDYDGHTKAEVIEEILYLQERFGLGDCHLLRSSTQGFHVICTQKFSLREFMQIMEHSSTDDAYKRIGFLSKRKHWTLRTSEKNGEQPAALLTLNGVRGREESKAHNEILRKLYNLIISGEYEDDSEHITTAHYSIKAKP